MPEPGIPIFTPLDDLRVVSPSEELPDLVYIDAPAPREAHCETHLASLPFHGRGWYARPAVEYLLHTKRIGWPELKWGITASGHVPGDALRGAF